MQLHSRFFKIHWRLFYGTFPFLNNQKSVENCKRNKKNSKEPTFSIWKKQKRVKKKSKNWISRNALSLEMTKKICCILYLSFQFVICSHKTNEMNEIVFWISLFRFLYFSLCMCEILKAKTLLIPLMSIQWFSSSSLYRHPKAPKASSERKMFYKQQLIIGLLYLCVYMWAWNYTCCWDMKCCRNRV